jgi:cephalosporin hydroxylase
LSDADKFRAEVKTNIEGLRQDRDVQALSRTWLREITRHKYAYNFSWMGRPIIQFPQDMIAMQEIIWDVQPELIIETGIAHGGSLIYYASLLEILGGDGYVLGIDIDIRAHNREAIETHPMFKRVQMIQASSISDEVATQVAEHCKEKKSVLVVLDSNHTHEHVLAELNIYARHVTRGSYVVVFDTLLEDMPGDLIQDRPWGPGNNPKTAVRQFLSDSDAFVIDKDIDSKLLITAAPDGYLKRVKD